jgi:hypothetical protein
VAPFLPTIATLLLAAAPAGAGDVEALPTPPLQALVAAGPGGLAPSPRAHALDGRRVRLVGYMAHLEEPPDGVFYLAASPVSCDEGGGGTADLPPDAVQVLVRSAAGAPVHWLGGLLEVTGRFRVGPEADAEGRVSFFRLVLDRPEDLATSIPAR